MNTAAIDYSAIASGPESSSAEYPVHRWFRYRASHQPLIVNHILDTIALPNGAHLHEPFSGAATTIIESALRGLRTSAIEINPFMQVVGRVALNRRICSDTANSLLEAIVARARGYASRLPGHMPCSLVPPEKRKDLLLLWRRDVLDDILNLKASIAEVPQPEYREFFTVSLAGVLVPELTNVRPERLGLVPFDRPGEMDAVLSFSNHARKMVDDLRKLGSWPILYPPLQIGGDATDVSTYRHLPLIDAVVSSPPYPNLYSYISHTLPYLMLFEQELGISLPNLRATIVGEPILDSEATPLSYEEAMDLGDLPASVKALCTRVRASSETAANYVLRYFGMIAHHVRALRTRLAEECTIAYVLGNTQLSGQTVETDILVGDILEAEVLGLRVRRVHRYRLRPAAGAHESIIYAAR